MSRLPKKLPFQESSINGIKDLDDMKRVFGDYVRASNELYDKLYDNIENGGFETNSWRVHEATAEDVTATIAIGDLLIQRDIDDIWTTAWTIKGT